MMTDLDAVLAETPEAIRPALKVVTAKAQPDPQHALWARFKPLFAQAMDGNFYNVETLEQQIFTGKAQLWPGKTCAIVTEIQTYPGGERALQTLWAAGEIAELLTLLPGIEAFGRLMGCDSMLVEGRAAWSRVLKPAGYAPWSVTLRKGLT